MTGTYNGLSDFNSGDSINLILRSICDGEYVYILAEWRDASYNASYKSWLFNGPPDPNKTDNTTGWTSQRNSDNITLNFISFNQSEFKQDVWKWDLALSDPLGYAIDMKVDLNDSLVYDAGKPTFIRNSTQNDNRTGPQYEWNGETQQITKANGTLALLDPTYYLMNGNTTDYTGDPSAGETILENICAVCHGTSDEQYAFAFEEFNLNPFSRAALVSMISANDHDGRSYFEKLDDTQIENLLAGLRGKSGLPGYLLQEPDGSAADIITFSNVNSTGIPLLKDKENEHYFQVLFKRKLNTSNPDDIIFETDNTYPFSLQLTDNDEINYIGIVSDTLVFTNE